MEGPPKRVLVLDRDPDVARVVGEVKLDHDVEVTVAQDVNEAVTEIERGGLALVVVEGPGVRKAGYQLLEWMDEHHVDVPVVVGTGEFDQPKLMGKFPEVVLIFEPKPMSVGQLSEMIELYAE